MKGGHCVQSCLFQDQLNLCLKIYVFCKKKNLLNPCQNVIRTFLFSCCPLYCVLCYLYLYFGLCTVCSVSYPVHLLVIPMYICASQSLFSHSYVVNEWLNSDCNVQIDIGLEQMNWASISTTLLKPWHENSKWHHLSPDFITDLVKLRPKLT
jgi:hypothetical protein